MGAPSRCHLYKTFSESTSNSGNLCKSSTADIHIYIASKFCEAQLHAVMAYGLQEINNKTTTTVLMSHSINTMTRTPLTHILAGLLHKTWILLQKICMLHCAHNILATHSNQEK